MGGIQTDADISGDYLGGIIGGKAYLVSDGRGGFGERGGQKLDRLAGGFQEAVRLRFEGDADVLAGILSHLVRVCRGGTEHPGDLKCVLGRADPRLVGDGHGGDTAGEAIWQEGGEDVDERVGVFASLG